MFGYHDTRPHAEHVSALYVRDLGPNHQDGLQVDQLTAAQPLMPNTAPLDFGALQQLDLDFFGINPQLFNEPVVATGGLLPAAAPPLPHAHPYGAPVAAPHTARQLRCLDPTHAAGCTRCRAAPAEDETHRYALVGDPGRKNGEKLLKSLLLRTPEWQSAPDRLALAATCEASHPSLARVLRREATSAAMRKRDFMAACRYWGLKSTLWQLKTGGDVPTSAARGRNGDHGGGETSAKRRRQR